MLRHAISISLAKTDLEFYCEICLNVLAHFRYLQQCLQDRCVTYDHGNDQAKESYCCRKCIERTLWTKQKRMGEEIWAFPKWQKTVDIDKISERLATSRSEWKIVDMRADLLGNIRIAIFALSKDGDISYASDDSIITEDFGMRRVFVNFGRKSHSETTKTLWASTVFDLNCDESCVIFTILRRPLSIDREVL